MKMNGNVVVAGNERKCQKIMNQYNLFNNPASRGERERRK